MRKKVTYRPSKAQSAFSAVVSGIFVLIGLFFVIPTFGAFGIFWTLVAAVGGIMSAYHAFGKGYIGPEIHIEDEGGAPPLDAGSRLERLEDLRDAGLISELEYREKRQDILDGL